MKIFGFDIKRASSVPKKFYNRGQYKIVDSPSSHMIEASTNESRTEDEILSPSKRGKLLDLTRNLVRNSSLFNTILGQITTNVVSTTGGKIVLSVPDDELNSLLKKSFFAYTRNVDFYTGDSLNHLLKRVLREYIIGGDCLLLFDDKLVEDSGKIMFFESNEIVDVAKEEIEKRYGKYATQINGKVYSANGRHIGTVVSKSQRGSELADPSKCYFLKKDPNASSLENGWFHFSCNWREGRGVSQAASAIATIHQLEDLVQSELMASRRNSQIFCWLTQNNKPEEQLPSAFDQTTDFESMSDEEIEAAVKQESEDIPTISFNRARENSVVYEALPDGVSAQQLQMQHPNSNIEVMVDWLANRCAATLGLSRIFATGNPDDSNWRSNQLFSYPAILELQKDLEQICDWIFNRYVKYLVSHSIVDVDANEVMKYVDWTWKGIDSLDPVANETAIQMQLKNMTKTYKDVLGNDWQSKLQQSAFERKWMLENGITPPQDLMVSGGQTDASKNQ